VLTSELPTCPVAGKVELLRQPYMMLLTLTYREKKKKTLTHQKIAGGTWMYRALFFNKKCYLKVIKR
jgi:hypothetical protein